MTSTNPYGFRKALKDSSGFVGRTRTIREILERISTPQANSVSVFGPPWVGKSSLLRRISDPRVQKAHLSAIQNYHFVYLDLESRLKVTMPGVLGTIYSSLIPDQRAPEELPRVYDDLWRSIKDLTADGRRLVVVLDQFQRISGNPSFPLEFFSFLRGLASNYEVCYVTATRSRLHEMCHNREIAASDFFNIFDNVRLLPFSPEEVGELLRQSESAAGPDLESFQDFVMALTGGFPLFAQILGKRLFELAGKEASDGRVMARASDDFKQDVAGQFAYIWNKGIESRQSCFQEACRGAPSDDCVAKVQELTDEGYLLPVGSNRYLPFSRVFGEVLGIEFDQHDAPHDVFIACNSIDYELGRLVHDHLVRHGVRAFFGDSTPLDSRRGDFGEEIDKALDSARDLIVVMSRGEHLESPFVKSEWKLFINEKRSGRKSGNVLCVHDGDVLVEHLPISLRDCHLLAWDDTGKERLVRWVASDK